MADLAVIQLRTTSLVRLIAPTDESTTPPTPLVTTGGTPSTCSFKVYDHGKIQELSATEATGQTILSVTNAGVFAVGDVVEVDLDSGAIHDAGAVTAVDPANGTITVTTGLASAAAAGRRVRVRLGPSVVMASYGTPVIGALDWGMVGTLAHNHPGLDKDRELEIEITLIGPAGAFQRVDVLCAVVRQVEDCDGV